MIRREGNYNTYSMWLEHELRQKLDRIAKKQKISLSILIENILKDYVEKEHI